MGWPVSQLIRRRVPICILIEGRVANALIDLNVEAVLRSRPHRLQSTALPLGIVCERNWIAACELMQQFGCATALMKLASAISSDVST
jgi:hypothetical protein